jgi:hypothetical protein
LLFGGGVGGFTAWSKGKAALDRLLPEDMPGWVLHDLRRSFVTHVNELGLAQPHVIEAAINHVSGPSKAGVAGIYNRSSYLAERRRLFDLWGSHVAALVAGLRGSVVPLEAARRKSA